MADGERPGTHFVPGSKQRSMRIEFEWPVKIDGRIHAGVNVRRLTQGEVAAWVSELGATPGRISWPVLRDDDDQLIPHGLMDALDADDFDVVNKAVLDFLPRRFRGALANASAPQGGVTTA